MNGILLMLCADLAFALMASATKALGLHLPASQIVFVRSALSLAACYWLLRSQGIPLRGNNTALLWARGIVGYIALQCYFWALPQLPLGMAVMLNYTAPIFAVIFSFLLLGERPPLLVKICLAASFGGIYLLSSPTLAAGTLPALLAGLASGFLAGGVYVMIRHSHKNDDPLLVIFYFVLSATIGSGALLVKQGWVAPDGREWLELLFITATSFMGQLYLTRSLRKAPVWLVSPFGYLTPVLGYFIGVFLWKEIPTAQSIVGGAVVIACGVLMLVFFRPDNAR